MSELARPEIGGYITLISGKKFHFNPVDPEEIFIEDIAHALSNICRWNGHVEEFYSVAQHSVLASKITDAKFALVALMHDASEAYIGDITRPFKQVIPEFAIFEERIMAAISVKYGFEWPMPPEVVAADNALLTCEHNQLRRKQDPHVWKPECDPLLAAKIGEISPWSPFMARRRFIDRFRKLRALQNIQADLFPGLEEKMARMEVERQRVMAQPALASTARRVYICECGHERSYHKVGLYIDDMNQREIYQDCQVDGCACKEYKLEVTVG